MSKQSIQPEEIRECIYILTGMKTKETITDERYELEIGLNNPLQMGYDKKRKLLSEDNMSFSAHLRMLEEICQMIKLGAEYYDWLKKNS